MNGSKYFCSALTLLSLHLQCVISDKEVLVVKNQFSILPKNYSALELPPGHPVTVSLSVEVMDTPALNDAAQEISMEITVFISWVDSRLRFTDKYRKQSLFTRIPTTDYDKIWLPELYLGILKKRLITSPITLSKHLEEFSLLQFGRVIYSARLTPTISCKMDFRRYPSDLQICTFDLYADTLMNELNLSWENASVVYHGEHDTQIHQVGFTHTVINESPNRDLETTITIYFQRKIGNHVLQTYIPSALIVIITWLSLCIPGKHALERLSLALTTLLTLVALFGSVRLMPPFVNYVKALDIWMAACVFSVFLVIVENIVVLNILAETLTFLLSQLFGTQSRLSSHLNDINLQNFNSDRSSVIQRSKSNASTTTLESSDDQGHPPNANGVDEGDPKRRSQTPANIVHMLDKICFISMSVMLVTFTLGYTCYLWAGDGMPADALARRENDTMYTEY